MSPLEERKWIGRGAHPQQFVRYIDSLDLPMLWGRKQLNPTEPPYADSMGGGVAGK
jgi:hypothetical protein